jgi:hypothetical protein
MSAYAERLRITAEFHEHERPHLEKLLFGRLERRLAHWRPDQVELLLSVTDRDAPPQRTVLECWIAGAPRRVATSTQTDLDRAVVEVRDDLVRLLDRLVTRREDARRR